MFWGWCLWADAVWWRRCKQIAECGGADSQVLGQGDVCSRRRVLMRYGRSVGECVESGCVVERVKNQSVRRKRVAFSNFLRPGWRWLVTNRANSHAWRVSVSVSAMCLRSMARHQLIIPEYSMTAHSTAASTETVHTGTRQVTPCQQRHSFPCLGKQQSAAVIADAQQAGSGSGSQLSCRGLAGTVAGLDSRACFDLKHMCFFHSIILCTCM